MRAKPSIAWLMAPLFLAVSGLALAQDANEKRILIINGQSTHPKGKPNEWVSLAKERRVLTIAGRMEQNKAGYAASGIAAFGPLNLQAFGTKPIVLRNEGVSSWLKIEFEPS